MREVASLPSRRLRWGASAFEAGGNIPQDRWRGGMDETARVPESSSFWGLFEFDDFLDGFSVPFDFEYEHGSAAFDKGSNEGFCAAAVCHEEFVYAFDDIALAESCCGEEIGFAFDADPVAVDSAFAIGVGHVDRIHGVEDLQKPFGFVPQFIVVREHLFAAEHPSIWKDLAASESFGGFGACFGSHGRLGFVGFFL